MKKFSQRELEAMSLFKLRDVARQLNIDNIDNCPTNKIIEAILNSAKPIKEEKVMFTKEDLEKLTLAQLKAIAKTEGIKATKKEDIINALVELDAKKAEAPQEEIKQEIVDSVPDATVDIPLEGETKARNGLPAARSTMIPSSESSARKQERLSICLRKRSGNTPAEPERSRL